jgi:Spy/CpxP family protein refolding chaperone
LHISSIFIARLSHKVSLKQTEDDSPSTLNQSNIGDTIMNKKMIASLMAVTLAASAGLTFANGNGNGQGNGAQDGSQTSQNQPSDRMNRGDRGMARAGNLDYIFGQLNLTEESQASVQAVLDAFAESQRELMKDQRDAMRNSDTRPSQEERDALRETHRAEAKVALTDQLNTVLSPDQTADLVEYLDAHMGNHQGGPKGGMKGKNR